MIQSKRILALCYIFNLLAFPLFSQIGEGNNDCTYSKEIIVPFNYTSTPGNFVKPTLNQTVFYSHRDQYSYWYKIILKEDALLRFKVSPINDSDTYAVFVYQYNSVDFCDKVYRRKITPVKPTFFADKNSQENPYDLSAKTFEAIKDNTYYISVLNTSLHNCGHNFLLINNKDTFLVKAIHIPCESDFSLLPVKSAAISDTLKKKDDAVTKIILPPSVTPIDTIKPNTLICYVKDNKKNTSLKIKPLITEIITGDELQIESAVEGEWRGKVKIGKSYKIKCQAIGYTNSEQKIEINKAITSINILLEPLKAGDNFVMKSIYFFPNTYALKKESGTDLQRLLNYLTENTNVTIEIQGHTNGDHRIAKNKAYSSLGEEWNFQGRAKELSQKRAEAIKKYLETNGINADRLTSKGYGGKKPIIKDPQDNEEGQMNIRVEIMILKD